MHTRPVAGRAWLSVFSAAYGLQQFALTARTHTTSTPLIDLPIFFAAARVAAVGGDPYDPRVLVAMEQRLFPTYGPLRGAHALTLPYMHGPLPLLALRPF